MYFNSRVLYLETLKTVVNCGYKLLLTSPYNLLNTAAVYVEHLFIILYYI